MPHDALLAIGVPGAHAQARKSAPNNFLAAGILIDFSGSAGF
jgi:hypothetical protein